ncbi:MAG: hypothetical protein FWB74_04770 [Defluviitaleaceae bacterium]|nr:hypothetical protein [Defluviitaleaceae bacterium]
MEYCLCVKENDKNLLHIITASELKKPLYGSYKQLAASNSEDDAIKQVVQLVEDFCQVYWDAGESPDFGVFKTWLEGVFG